MKYVVIGICIAIIAVIIATVFFYKKKNQYMHCEKKDTGVSWMDSQDSQVFQNSGENNGFVIKVETLPVESILDEGKLVEITDSKILAHVNNLVPGFVQAGMVGNNAVQATKAGGEVLYRVIIPSRAKLTDSKTMEGAVRGFYRGTDSIQGHANLVTVEKPKGTAIVTNTVVAAMGVASMVVGQYYMTQINTELDKISDSISKISDFQDYEFKSKVSSLIVYVTQIADFQVEILENKEFRLSKINQLDRLEEKCTELLGQANLTLNGYTKKREENYTTYERQLKDAQTWFIYQKILLNVLYKISDLTYTLHLGTVSREQCTASLLTYTKQVSDIQEMLTDWHQNSIKRFNIDIENEKRKRVGLDGFIHRLPGLVNNDKNFRSISNSTASMIIAQSAGYNAAIYQSTSELYAKDVQLISKEGKIYYFPEVRAE